jgi:hypothetical protein
LLDAVQHLYNQANERLSTGRLNRAIKEILAQRTPSSPSGRRVKIYYATQVTVAPPTIALFVNNPEFLDAGYQRFMINRFRELLPYAEVPIKLILRGREGGKRVGAEAVEEPGEEPLVARRPASRPKPAPQPRQRPGKRPHARGGREGRGGGGQSRGGQGRGGGQGQGGRGGRGGGAGGKRRSR